MFFRRLWSRREPWKRIHPGKRLKVDGRTLRRRRYKKPKPPKRRLTVSQRIAYPTVFAAIAVYFFQRCRWSYYRVCYAIYDLLLALAEYLLRVMQIDTEFLPIRINEIPDVPYVPFLPLEPSALEGFWQRYFSALFDGDRFLLYIVKVIVLLLRAQQFVIPGLILFFVGKILLRDFIESENDDFGKISRSVRFCKWLGDKLEPIVNWCRVLWYRASLSYLVWSTLGTA